MKRKIIIALLSITLILGACSNKKQVPLEESKDIDGRIDEILSNEKNKNMENPNEGVDYSKSKLATIYLAGGCFWGVEAYMERIYGVFDAVSGYANGNTENPSYEDVSYGNSGHAEAVEVTYDPDRVSLSSLLEYFFKVVDPTSLNKQGNDRGKQYRSGIYFTDEADKMIIEEAMNKEQKKYDKKIVVEVENLKNFYPAEDYHQDYLKKNPGGYCHIDLAEANEPIIDPKLYPKPTDEELRKKLSKEQYQVSQEGDTEHAYSNLYWDNKEKGIYVDVATGEPLFSSRDKFDSGCGWPSFTKPISKELVTYQQDNSYNMTRIEVRSRVGNSHLGHVFNDGPQDEGGLRYCINSSSIEFIALDEMPNRGYGYLESVVK